MGEVSICNAHLPDAAVNVHPYLSPFFMGEGGAGSRRSTGWAILAKDDRCQPFSLLQNF